jgi:hypothetical protein
MALRLRKICQIPFEKTNTSIQCRHATTIKEGSQTQIFQTWVQTPINSGVHLNESNILLL